jgi:D-beta-D-heptose 7-phosphate kinase / D-beta-D-heptose 1-phosphate adenosyltransferase
MIDPVAPLTDLFLHLSERTVWVLGDVMLDEYLIGSVERISPEGPVPVLRVEDRELRPGGAANVARQVAALGARVVLGGVVGTDGAGEELLNLCKLYGVDARGVVAMRDRPTTRKTRALSKGHQLMRVDWEMTRPVGDDTAQQLLARLECAAAPDLIVISDYAKGVVDKQLMTRLGSMQETAGCRILVDPKQRDFDVYRGARILTPNLTELSHATRRTLDPEHVGDIASEARKVAKQHAFDAIVVTLGERGLLVVPSEGTHEHVPAVRRMVFDVTGAGDTVIGVLAAALAVGSDLAVGARLANTAAGVAVGEVGTVAVTAEQIDEALRASSALKILDRAALANRVISWRAAGKRIVFTNGCFDLLHAGHLALLRAAAEQGDVLVLAINSDTSIRRLKGPGRPLVSEAERAALLAALECVDAVTIFAEDTPLETLSVVHPHVLVKGADYRADQVVGRDLVERDGGQVVLVPLEGSWSTSGLVERIRRTTALTTYPPA